MSPLSRLSSLGLRCGWDGQEHGRSFLPEHRFWRCVIHHRCRDTGTADRLLICGLIIWIWNFQLGEGRGLKSSPLKPTGGVGLKRRYTIGQWQRAGGFNGAISRGHIVCATVTERAEDTTEILRVSRIYKNNNQSFKSQFIWRPTTF